jgi:hypothetical protein
VPALVIGSARDYLIRGGLVVAAIRVVVPVMVVVPSASIDHKIRAAAVIYPNAFVIRSPTVALLASGFTSLLGELNPASSIDLAIVPASVVGGAGDRYGRSFPVGFKRKISSAAVIYPNISVIGAPTVAFLTSGLATLLRHSHPATSIQRTIVPAAVVRRTRNNLRFTFWAKDCERGDNKNQTNPIPCGKHFVLPKTQIVSSNGLKICWKFFIFRSGLLSPGITTVQEANRFS